MRPVVLGPSPGCTKNGTEKWLEDGVRRLALASQDISAEKVADAFMVSPLTPTYTLDPTTASAEDVANFIGTFIRDLRQRGQKKRSA